MQRVQAELELADPEGITQFNVCGKVGELVGQALAGPVFWPPAKLHCWPRPRFEARPQIPGLLVPAQQAPPLSHRDKFSDANCDALAFGQLKLLPHMLRCLAGLPRKKPFYKGIPHTQGLAAIDCDKGDAQGVRQASSIA